MKFIVLPGAMRRAIASFATGILVLTQGSGSGWAQTPTERAPQLQPFAGSEWVLGRSVSYNIRGSGDTIVVPAGFVTDFASIPWGLQSLIQVNTPSRLPALVHDYLYWEQGCTRVQADGILWVGLQEHGIAWWERTLFYRGVRVGGGAAWNLNMKDRQQGLPRVIPEALLGSITQGTRWSEFRTELWNKGHRPSPKSAIPARVCAHGDG